MRVVKIKTHPLVELSVKVTDEMIEDYRDCRRQAQVLGSGKDCRKCSWDNVIVYDDMYACFLDVEVLLEEGAVNE